MEENNSKKYNKVCRTCEFCLFNDKNQLICGSYESSSELGYGNKVYDFKKNRSCWYVGYEEYIRCKRN